MKWVESLLYEVKVLDDGAILGRRKDRKQFTQDDLKAALALADSELETTGDDVLRVFAYIERSK